MWKISKKKQQKYTWFDEFDPRIRCNFFSFRCYSRIFPFSIQMNWIFNYIITQKEIGSDAHNEDNSDLEMQKHNQLRKSQPEPFYHDVVKNQFWRKTKTTFSTQNVQSSIWKSQSELRKTEPVFSLLKYFKSSRYHSAVINSSVSVSVLKTWMNLQRIEERLSLQFLIFIIIWRKNT